MIETPRKAMPVIRGSRVGRPRVMFIARAYPPTLGGMENLALQLNRHLTQYVDVVPLINRRGKKALPAFLPYAAAAAISRVRKGDVDCIHLADALLAPVGAIVRATTGVPVTASICGLDVTYDNRAYQAAIPSSLRRLDLTMPISRATDEAMRERTGDRPRSQVIPLGVNPLPAARASAVESFDRVAGGLDGKRVVLTVGRLIERKGAAWFAANVLPRLANDVLYVVVGDGPHRDAIVHAAEASGVAHRLRMMGRVTDEVLSAAYRRADVFIMPNVPVPGDMEGFGLVALEAAASGMPVVASALEGITEAVQHERNGFLVRPRDGAEMAATLQRLLDLPEIQRREIGEMFAQFTLREYGWARTAERYAELFSSLVAVREQERLAA